MKCKYCDGTGEHINDANRMTTCEFCGGTGVIKSLTNEEWIHTLNTEQLAEWLNNKIIICAVCDQQKSCEYLINETCHLCPFHEGKNKSWEVWLKQPHSPK